MKLFVGIDPGAKGALAAIDEKNCIIAGFDWPGDEIQTAAKVREFLDDHTVYNPIKEGRPFQLYAALEYVHSRPGQGVASVFSFGANYGIWQGVLASFQIPYMIVSPKEWQKGILKKISLPTSMTQLLKNAETKEEKKKAKSKIAAMRKKAIKKAIMTAAARIFPAAELYGPRGGKKDGRADALLIALWCKKEVLGK